MKFIILNITRVKFLTVHVHSFYLFHIFFDMFTQVLMALPDKAVIGRALRRFRSKALNQGDDVLPPPPNDITFQIPDRFTELILFDSLTSDNDAQNRIIIIGDPTLVGGLHRSALWLADGTFKKVPNLFFQLYTIHFELGSGIHPAGLYCLLPNKTEATYQRLFTQVVNLLPNSRPDVILTDFEMAAISAFRCHFPNSKVTGCYFHLTPSVLRKVGEIGMRPSYYTDEEIRGMVRCLAALAHVPVDDIVSSFEALAAEMPQHSSMDELLSYFEHTYIRGRRMPGRGDNYRPALFPPQTWNQRESAAEGIARTTNIVEGWHFSLHSLFLCDHPSMWFFLEGLAKDIASQKACFLQGIAGGERPVRKSYMLLKKRVQRSMDMYNQTDIITYLRAIAHLTIA